MESLKNTGIKKEKIENTENQVLDKIIKHIESNIEIFKKNDSPLKEAKTNTCKFRTRNR